MANCALEYWNQRTLLSYRQMQKRHKLLWEYIKRFILDSDIKSVLEVGCGLNSPVKAWVKDYTAIDLNENVKAIHKDFTKMEPFEVLEHDLLLACGVIEHCDGYTEFLRQVKRFNFTHSLITFFCGLDRDEEIYRVHKDGYIINQYSQKKIESVLSSLDMRHFFVNLTPHDDVLVIMQEGKNGS